jgi:hypothetical protein
MSLTKDTLLKLKIVKTLIDTNKNRNLLNNDQADSDNESEIY